MKLYYYQVKHSVGEASGTVEAENKKDAETKITEQYTATHKDPKGKTVKSGVVKLDVKLAEG